MANSIWPSLTLFRSSIRPELRMRLLKYGSCPRSVIDDKRFYGNALRLNLPVADLQGRVIGLCPETQKLPGCLLCGTSAKWCGSESAPELPRASGFPKPLLRREPGQRRRHFGIPRTQTLHLAVAHETQAGSQLQGSKGPQMPSHLSDTSLKYMTDKDVPNLLC